MLWVYAADRYPRVEMNNFACKGVQRPSSGVEFAPVCTPVRCPRCRKENFACEVLQYPVL